MRECLSLYKSLFCLCMLLFRYNMKLKEYAKISWDIANRCMESDNKYLNIDGLEWTGIAKVLDELSGNYNWGIFECLEEYGR